MILDFSAKLGDHEVTVQVAKLDSGKYWTTIQEFDLEKKLIVDIDATFVSKDLAVKFAKLLLSGGRNSDKRERNLLKL